MERPLTKNIRPNTEPLSLKEYEKSGGYQAARKILTMSPQNVQNVVKTSNLRGRGGAGFPTGQKWSFVPMGPESSRPKYFVVNADEMEPGTFKDRFLLEGDPNQLIEGAIASSYAIEAEQAFIFIRREYKLAIKRLCKGHCRGIHKQLSRQEHSWFWIQPRSPHPHKRWPLYVRRRNRTSECS